MRTGPRRVRVCFSEVHLPRRLFRFLVADGAHREVLMRLPLRIAVDNPRRLTLEPMSASPAVKVKPGQFPTHATRLSRTGSKNTSFLVPSLSKSGNNPQFRRVPKPAGFQSTPV